VKVSSVAPCCSWIGNWIVPDVLNCTVPPVARTVFPTESVPVAWALTVMVLVICTGGTTVTDDDNVGGADVGGAEVGGAAPPPPPPPLIGGLVGVEVGIGVAVAGTVLCASLDVVQPPLIA